MVNDDLIKCPVCSAFTHIENRELLAALRDPKVREQIEKFAAQLRRGQEELAGVGAGEKRDFQKDVHNWNPNVPMWRRSSKE